MELCGFQINSISKQVVLFTCAIYVLCATIYGLYHISWDFNPFKSSSNTTDSVSGIHNIFNTSHIIVENKSTIPPIIEELTVVTAYFNLKKFNKGGGRRSHQDYQKWMNVFGRINNSLVVFSDEQEVLDTFSQLRSKFPKHRTKLIKVSRSELWSFSLAPKIGKIFKQPGYPVHHPNTVMANYSCVMHAKFELVHRVIKEKLYTTKYIAWLDIGLFRDIVNQKYIFKLLVPADFQKGKIAYTEAFPRDTSLKPRDVIYRNLVWVCGAMFLGFVDDVALYTEDYMSVVKKLIHGNLMSTDQQVIYIMYLPAFHFKHRVEIQTYKNPGDIWFYLGYLCKHRQ